MRLETNCSELRPPSHGRATPWFDRNTRIAVVGAGISGLAAAWLLSSRYDVELFESADYLGGHASTREVRFGNDTVPVDTGFIVFNDRNYPNLIALFSHLCVETKASDMSFSVSLDGGRLEYAGSLPGLVAQPTNLLRADYWAFLRDLPRFLSADTIRDARDLDPETTLETWLDRKRFSKSFVRNHLLPMGAAIWSCPMGDMLNFPATSFLTFFAQHGLLQFRGRPRWRTVAGGSRNYVAKIAAEFRGRIHLSRPVVRVRDDNDEVVLRLHDGGEKRFDHVVLAVHGNQALSLLAGENFSPQRRLLAAFRTLANRAYLHSDPALMPHRRSVWSAWNYMGSTHSKSRENVSVSYWMNRLQGIDKAFPLYVTLNPLRPPKSELTHGAFDYQHPVFDSQAVLAQTRLTELQGLRGVWYCGAWQGHGFHEDGLVSAIQVANAFGVRAPWQSQNEAAGQVVRSQESETLEAVA